MNTKAAAIIVDANAMRRSGVAPASIAAVFADSEISALRWIDTESQRRFGVRYHQATEAQRHELLDDISGPMQSAKPEFRHGTAFFSNLDGRP